MQFAIRCLHSVTFPSRGEFEMLLQAWLVLWVVLLEQYKCSVVPSPIRCFLYSLGRIHQQRFLPMMNCLFSHGAKLPTCRHEPFVHPYDNYLPILIDPLQVVDYGLHVEQLVNPDCRSLRVADPEVLEDEEQNLSTSL